MSQDRVEPTISPSQTLRIQIPNRQVWDDEKQVICQNGIVWFTDGSKIGDMAGAGLWENHRDRTSFCPGVICHRLPGRGVRHIGVRVGKPEKGSKRGELYRFARTVRKTLNDLASRNKMILTWVPGHSGVRGNEEADRLVREGLSMYPIGPEHILGVPYSMGVSAMKELLTKAPSADWDRRRPRMPIVSAIARVRERHFGSSVLNPEDVKSIQPRKLYTFAKEVGIPG
ncbi:hypothetical protein NQ317_006187 [Molorchus minor]|uniref:RNase H type-1 domain-containing protein n=1 Tax=Molorchus minor TaxID=1323400 RepID=A0ABQ9IWW5_9CUCU|nr:hypothetical protein NQ317_006187 [Molorchus minor]